MYIHDGYNILHCFKMVQSSKLENTLLYKQENLPTFTHTHYSTVIVYM